MANFFAFATKNSWDEDVFQLTTGGIPVSYTHLDVYKRQVLNKLSDLRSVFLSDVKYRRSAPSSAVYPFCFLPLFHSRFPAIS